MARKRAEAPYVSPELPKVPPYVAFTVFDAESGAVLRTGSARQDHLSIQAQHGREIVVEGKFAAETTARKSVV